MCTNPVTLPDGRQFACRVCWQCRENRVQDWVGRCIAESKTAWQTKVATLTYGRDAGYQVDHIRAQVLTYSDVQGWLKRMRYHTPGGLRFFAVGEYGHAKGRAHWHVIVFFNAALPPDYREGERYLQSTLWPHGWSYWDAADEKSIRYAVKYILKENGRAEQQNAYGMSSRPPLGVRYFEALAAEYVKAGLAPQDLAYGFAECVQRSGEPIEYRLRGASAYYYLSAFRHLWIEMHGNDRWPQSDLMDAFIDVYEARQRRAAGIPDETELDFAARFELNRREKKGSWPLVNGSGSLVETQDHIIRRRVLDALAAHRVADRYRRMSKGDLPEYDRQSKSRFGSKGPAR